METSQIIGILASICTGVSLLPQLIKIIREKKADHLSLGMMAVLLGGLILWVIYGLYKSDLIIILSNATSLLLNIATIIVSLKYRSPHSK